MLLVASLKDLKGIRRVCALQGHFQVFLWLGCSLRVWGLCGPWGAVQGLWRGSCVFQDLFGDRWRLGVLVTCVGILGKSLGCP